MNKLIDIQGYTDYKIDPVRGCVLSFKKDPNGNPLVWGSYRGQLRVKLYHPKESKHYMRPMSFTYDMMQSYIMQERQRAVPNPQAKKPKKDHSLGKKGIFVITKKLGERYVTVGDTFFFEETAKKEVVRLSEMYPNQKFSYFEQVDEVVTQIIQKWKNR